MKHNKSCAYFWAHHDNKGAGECPEEGTELGRLSLDLIAPHHSLTGGCIQAGVGLFSQVTSERFKKRRPQGFRLNIRKNSFTERAVEHWNGLPMKAVEAFKIRVDAALGEMV